MILIEKSLHEAYQDFIISNKQLEDAFPKLYKYYKQIYGSQRPKINVHVEENYIFAPNLPDTQSDYFVDKIYVIQYQSDVKYFDVNDHDGESNSKYKAKFDLSLNDGVLECHTGYHKFVDLYISPTLIAGLISSDDPDLTEIEQYVLLIVYGISSAYRLEYFIVGISDRGYHPPRENGVLMTGAPSGGAWQYPTKMLYNQAIELGRVSVKELWLRICSKLQSKGLAKVNKAGSVQLTLEGKNMAIAIEKTAHKKKYGA